MTIMQVQKWMLLLLAIAPLRAADFVNLNFDEGSQINVVIHGDIATFLPGWSLRYDDEIQSTIGVNIGPTVSRFGVALLAGRRNSFGIPVEGLYSLGLGNGAEENGTQLIWSLSQSGDVPPDAKSIRFGTSFNPLSIQIDGEELSTVFLESKLGFEIFGADISRFAGKTVNLEFHTRPLGFNEAYVVDTISFSPVAVPESRSFILFLAAIGVALTTRMRK